MSKVFFERQSRKNDRRCKLSDDDIAFIRRATRKGIMKYPALADMFGVSVGTIWLWAKEENKNKRDKTQSDYYKRVLKAKLDREKLRKYNRTYLDRHREKVNDYHRRLGRFYRNTKINKGEVL